MIKHPINPIPVESFKTLNCRFRRLSGWRRLLALASCFVRPAVCLALGFVVFLQPARADVVVVDDDFGNGDPTTNTNGVGTGFSTFGGNVSEASSLLQLSSGAGWAKAVAASKNPATIGAGGTKFEFKGTSFAGISTGTANTDRVYLGVGTNSVAGDWDNATPPGFWIQFNSDSLATGTGNGAWTGTSVLFFKDTTGYITQLASWTFDTLKWNDSGVTNFTPVLDITLTLNNTSWVLNITGDTYNSGSPISFSGNYADYGLNLSGFGGATCADLYCQAEGPGIRMSVDRVLVTQLGNTIVPTPVLTTPDYPYNTNHIFAGETALVSCAVVSTGSPTYQWQMEDPPYSGTYSNITGATSTNLTLDTSGLGDYQPRGIRLIVTDSGSITSSVVTLTADPASVPVLTQDTTPPGPEVRSSGLSITYNATFSGNHPMSYNWQKSPDYVTWTNIPDATNASLNLTSLTTNDAGYYRLYASNSIGACDNPSSGSQLIISDTLPKFIWSTPVPYTGLTADEILTNFPNTKIAGAMRMNGGPTTVTLGGGLPIVFANRDNWAFLSGGYGTSGGARNNTLDTGNANFNTCLDNFYIDSSVYTITFSNLVVGQQYSVQLFSLDDRTTISPPASSRLVNYQDPADVNDISATFALSDNVYIVGTFYASNTTESVQENLLAGTGNFNCLVLRAVGWNPPP